MPPTCVKRASRCGRLRNQESGLPRPSMLWRGVGRSGGRGTASADLLRRMPVDEPSLVLTGVLCTLRLSLLEADSLPELTRLSESLRTQHRRSAT